MNETKPQTRRLCESIALRSAEQSGVESRAMDALLAEMERDRRDEDGVIEEGRRERLEIEYQEWERWDSCQ